MVKVQVAKKIKFEQAVTTLKKFVFKSPTRPILQFIYFDGTHLIATDSYRLVRIHKDAVDGLTLKKGQLYDPKTKKVPTDFEGKSYPDVTRLIPDTYNAKTSMTFEGPQMLDFKQHIELAQIMVKKMERQPVKLSVIRKSPRATYLDVYAMHEDDTHSDGSYRGKLTNINIDGQEMEMWANAQFLLDAHAVMKKFDGGKLYLYDKLKPMLFTQENVFDVLVLPIRRG